MRVGDDDFDEVTHAQAHIGADQRTERHNGSGTGLLQLTGGVFVWPWQSDRGTGCAVQPDYGVFALTLLLAPLSEGSWPRSGLRGDGNMEKTWH